MREKVYKYLIDGVTREKQAPFRNAVAQVRFITKCEFSAPASTLIVGALSNPQESVELACRVVGVHFRSRVP